MNVKPAPAVPKLLWTINELHAATSIPIRTLWQLRMENKIPFKKVGRRTLFPVRLMTKWAEENLVTCREDELKLKDGRRTKQ